MSLERAVALSFSWNKCKLDLKENVCEEAPSKSNFMTQMSSELKESFEICNLIS